jgi:hypothetical protein
MQEAMMQPILINELRERYPNPTTYEAGATDPAAYCVAGALCLHLQEREPFPTADTLVEVLLKINPAFQKDLDAAYGFADAITEDNDRQAFDTAWGLLGQAMAWQVGEPLPEEIPDVTWNAWLAWGRELGGINAAQL